MKKISKILAVILVLCMTAAFVPFASAEVEAEQNGAITIYIDGINAENLISTTTGETVFPPQAKSIVKAVTKALPSLSKSMLTGNYTKAGEPLADAVYTLFEPIACDENGVPSPETTIDWKLPDEEEMEESFGETVRLHRFRFAFDWRLDMQTVASQLHEYIECLLDYSGIKSVNLVGFSMGTCAVMSYLKMYDYEYVKSVVLLAGAYNGVSCCGQPFAGKVSLDTDALVRFIDSMVSGNGMSEVFVSALMHNLRAVGLVDTVVNIGNDITEQLFDEVYKDVFAKTFVTMPGMWALVPDEYFEAAMELAEPYMTDVVREKVMWYHDEIQAHNEDIIDELFARKINFGIIAKYGTPSIPVIDDKNANSDGMIDTRYESFGATVADVTTTLGDDYVQAVDVGFNAISPDNMIDASTAKYCKYTWFVKNVKHADDNKYLFTLIKRIMYGKKQINVNSQSYTQFLTLEGDKLVPLSAENDIDTYVRDMSNENIFTVFIRFIKSFNATVKEMFDDLFAKIKR